MCVGEVPGDTEVRTAHPEEHRGGQEVCCTTEPCGRHLECLQNNRCQGTQVWLSACILQIDRTTDLLQATAVIETAKYKRHDGTFAMVSRSVARYGLRSAVMRACKRRNDSETQSDESG